MVDNINLESLLNLNGLIDGLNCLDINIKIKAIIDKIKKLESELSPNYKIIKLTGLNSIQIDLYTNQLIINKKELEYQVIELNKSIENVQATLSEEKNKLVKKDTDYKCSVIEKNIIELENILKFYKKELENILNVKEKTNKQLEHVCEIKQELENNSKEINIIEDENKILSVKNKLNEYLEYIYPITYKEQFLYFEIKDLNQVDLNILKFYLDDKTNINIEKLNNLYEKVKQEKLKLENKLKSKSNYIKNSINYKLKSTLENNLLCYDIQLKTLENNIKSNEMFIKLYEDNIKEYSDYISKLKNKNIDFESSNDEDILKEIKKNNKMIKELKDKQEKLNKLIISLDNTNLNLKKNKKSLEFIILHNKKELSQDFSDESLIDNDNLLNDKVKLEDIRIIEIVLKIHLEYNKLKSIKFCNIDNLYITSWISAENTIIEKSKENDFINDLKNYFEKEREYE